MVLGKLPVLGRPTNFDSSRARTYCAAAGAGRGRGGGQFFLSSVISHFFLPLSLSL